MHIRTAAPEEWATAFELALNHLGADIRTTRVLNALSLVAGGEIDPQGIFVAQGASGLRGVQICVPLAGASGLFWLPKSDPADDLLEGQLVQAALDWLHVRGAKLAQALLGPRDNPRALLKRGFQYVTRLRYLEHLLDPLPSQNRLRLRYTSYGEENRDLFHAVLWRTYEATLDCPELNGVRNLEETIAGHMAQGNFRPERWWLAHEAGKPVAVVMVTEVADFNAWDLSYLGVVPEARRRGIARELAGHVLRAAHKAQAPKLVLAVDDRNQPALQLYEELGFLSVDFREVYLHFWNRSLAMTIPKAGFDNLT